MKKVITITENDIKHLVYECVLQYTNNIITESEDESKFGNIARTAALGLGLAGGLAGGMNNANAQNNIDSLINQRNHYYNTIDSIFDANGIKASDKIDLPGYTKSELNRLSRKLYGKDTNTFNYNPQDYGYNQRKYINARDKFFRDKENRKAEIQKNFDSVNSINKQIQNSLSDLNQCQYRVIITTDPKEGAYKYNDRAIVNGRTVTVSYGPYGTYNAHPADTICNKIYNGINELLANLPVLLNRLAKEKEYNDTKYVISVRNVTTETNPNNTKFNANYLKTNKKVLGDEINRFINSIKRNEYKGFEQNRLNLHAKYTGYKEAPNFIRTQDGHTIYTDDKDDYIFDENMLTFKKLEKKKPL